MRIIFFIILFFIFSCEEELGVQEFQEAFNYYDFVAYGWGEYFKGNYTDAQSWFEQALTIEDVDEDGETDNTHHSAYLSLSWLATKMINNDVDDFNDPEIDNQRADAIKYLFYYQNEDGSWNLEDPICSSGTWDDGDCIVDRSDENNDELTSGYNVNRSDKDAADIYDSQENEDGTTFCEQNYCCSNCFIKDKRVALFYYYIKKYNDYVALEDMDTAENFFSASEKLGLEIIQDVDGEYDFMDGKPVVGNPQIIEVLNYTNIILALGNLYVNMSQESDTDYYCQAAEILSNVDECSGADCTSASGMDIITSCTTNID